MDIKKDEDYYIKKIKENKKLNLKILKEIKEEYEKKSIDLFKVNKNGDSIIKGVALFCLDYAMFGDNVENMNKVLNILPLDLFIKDILEDYSCKNILPQIVQNRSSSLFLKKIIENLNLNDEKIKNSKGIKSITENFYCLNPILKKFNIPSDFVLIIYNWLKDYPQYEKQANNLLVAYSLSIVFQLTIEPQYRTSVVNNNCRKIIKLSLAAIKGDFNKNDFDKIVEDLYLNPNKIVGIDFMGKVFTIYENLIEALNDKKIININDLEMVYFNKEITFPCCKILKKLKQKAVEIYEGLLHEEQDKSRDIVDIYDEKIINMIEENKEDFDYLKKYPYIINNFQYNETIKDYFEKYRVLIKNFKISNSCSFSLSPKMIEGLSMDIPKQYEHIFDFLNNFNNLLANDKERFKINSILKDIFMGLRLSDFSREQFFSVVNETIKKNNLNIKEELPKNVVENKYEGVFDKKMNEIMDVSDALIKIKKSEKNKA